MTKMRKTLQRENAIYEIIASNPTKEFTAPGVRDELRIVYGDDTIHQNVWVVIKRLEEMGLVSRKSLLTRLIYYSVVNGSKISEMVNHKVGFTKPKKKKSLVNKEVVKKDSDQDFDPLDYVSKDNYDRIVKRLEEHAIPVSKEMIVVVLAVMAYCIKRKTTTFSTNIICAYLSFLTKMTVMSKLQLLANKKCIFRGEDMGNGIVGYRINVKPIDFNSNIYLGSLIPLNNDKEIVEEESPSDKIAGVSLSTEQIGLGIVDFINKADVEREELITRIGDLVKENAELLKINSELRESLEQLTNDFTSLTSSHKKLKATSSAAGEITLRNIDSTPKKRVGL